MEPITSINITETREITGVRKYTMYLISLKGPVRSWNVARRYSDFHALNESLLTISKTRLPCDLPRKKLLNMRKEIVEERKVLLEQYLQAILYSKETSWRRSKPWHKFLELPETFVVEPLKAKASNDIHSTKWLTEFDSFNGFLNEIRSYINQRDSLISKGDTTAAQSSKLQARKGMNLAQATFSRLEQSLKTSEHQQAVSGGELVRRQNMISNLKIELANLEIIVNEIASSKQLDGIRINDSKNARMELFKPGSYGSFSKRTSGIPSRIIETEKTRLLENQELLDQQNQTMQMQDEMVEQISHVIKRQREIGMAISDELDLQNALLQQVDEKVDKVDQKMKVVDKKVNRILKG